MNKLGVLFLVLLCYGCNNSGMENAKGQQPEHYKITNGFVVTSNVTPAYLLNLEEYYSRNYKYTEFLNMKGFPEKLEVHDAENNYSVLKYAYDADNRLTSIMKIYTMRKGKTGQTSDTTVYSLKYSDATDANPVFINYKEYEILFYTSFLIKEFTFKQQNESIGNGKFNIYDALGRPVSLILFYDHGLDSEISYEKYIYSSDDSIWNSRQVEQVTLKIDNENLSTEKLREELLKFPADFDQAKTTFIETRQVETWQK